MIARYTDIVSKRHSAVGRVVADHDALPRITHLAAILQHLHWLPVNQRNNFKLATLTHYTLSACLRVFDRATTGLWVG